MDNKEKPINYAAHSARFIDAELNEFSESVLVAGKMPPSAALTLAVYHIAIQLAALRELLEGGFKCQ
jgi:hypothetical protein